MKKDCIILNGDKGMYTLEEIIELLRKNKVSYRVVTKNRSSKSRLVGVSVPILEIHSSKIKLKEN